MPATRSGTPGRGTVRARRGATGRRPPSYHHGDLRRALVEAAAGLVAERGAAGVTVREVGRSAGVSHAAPYHHFPDKDALMAAVAEEGFRRFDAAQARALEALPGHAAATERFAALGRAYVAFARSDPQFLDVMFRSGGTDGRQYPDLAALAGRTFQRLLDEVAAVLGIDDPRDPRVRSAAMFAWSTVHGFAALWLHGRIGPTHGDFDVLVTALLRHAARGLAPEGTPRRSSPQAPVTAGAK
jgi:AcrR family transcriptional regulator